MLFDLISTFDTSVILNEVSNDHIIPACDKELRCLPLLNASSLLLKKHGCMVSKPWCGIKEHENWGVMSEGEIKSTASSNIKVSLGRGYAGDRIGEA